MPLLSWIQIEKPQIPAPLSSRRTTSGKLFWPETLVYLLRGAELNQMLTLVVAIKSETPCEPEMLLFAGMNDHLHAAGLL